MYKYDLVLVFWFNEEHVWGKGAERLCFDLCVTCCTCTRVKAFPMLASDGLDLTCTTDTSLTLYNIEQMLTLLTQSRIRKHMVFSLWMLHVLLVVCSYYFCVQILFTKREKDYEKLIKSKYVCWLYKDMLV